ncbi:unnamed protein product [Phaedon cochleariae]|uniref:DnaJ homolog subfamily C member 21 n=1 Tax=Phaedon cochleariae TaxID=80249 RepID=A0A9N9SBA5_PHACE|nr:unnamed protein product [Phaedon cochleariae]
MKCHYEVLDVPRDADDAEIKSSYRKLALKWHPDKNLNDPENAKEQFQIVQQAYEVLSDRQERAWYDNHREQILRGSSSNFQDKSLDVFQYFTTTCFKGYGDDENGFYAVYRNVFEKIAKEDMEFMEDKEEFCDIPSFGNSQSDYENVSEFYAYWLNYSTKKSYVWLDPHDIKDIRDRRYLKLVEKENKKVRQNAKKERNEELRSLVAFVRKRDKRVQAQKKVQEQKLLEDKKKREMLSKQKRLERQEELNKSKDQPEWTKFDNVKSELKEIERTLAEQFGEEFSNSENESDDEYLNNLYCVACNKIFKTPKAFENHESSKKHKENVFSLKETMLEEEIDISSNIENNDEVETNDSLVEIVEEEVLTDVPSESESIDDTQKSRKKKKKPRNIINLDEVEIQDLGSLELVENSDDNFGTNKKPKKKNRKNATNTINKVKDDAQENQEKSTEETPEKVSEKKVAMRKKKEKKGKNEITASEIQEIDTDHNCVTCKSNFTSKNKLFDHLKKTGHGVYIPPNVITKSKKKNIKEK